MGVGAEATGTGLCQGSILGGEFWDGRARDGWNKSLPAHVLLMRGRPTYAPTYPMDRPAYGTIESGEMLT